MSRFAFERHEMWGEAHWSRAESLTPATLAITQKIRQHSGYTQILLGGRCPDKGRYSTYSRAIRR